VPHKYVHIEGVATFLHHRGPTTLPEASPDTSRGEVIVALHDAGGSGASFDALFDALEGRHSPLAFDQPGHGRSGGLDSLGDVAAMAGFALNLVRKLSLRPAVWLGEGLGAAVALEVARQDPEVVRACVICAPPEGGSALSGKLAALERVAAGKARREFDASGFAPGTPREVLGRAFADWLKTDPRVTAGDLRALAEGDVVATAASVSAPCLVVTGDAADSPSADGLVARIAGSRRLILSGAGTHPALEQPAALAVAVEAFLDESLPEVAR